MLLHLIILHPARPEVDELVAELARDGADEEAVIETAGRLCDEGLAHREGNWIRPTGAAIRSYELWEG
jgi:hypothetical protein